MGAAISIPLFSYFALPALNSYGTSANLLFFTLNWYILLLTHPPLQVEIIGIAAVQILLYLLPAILFLLFDTGLPSLAAQIKAQGDLALPGRSGRKKVAKIAGWSIFNLLMGIALQLGLELLLTKVLHVRSALSLSKTMPLPWTIAKQVGTLILLRGILQYYIHRHVLHNSRSPLAKLHLAWQHSIPAPFSLIATYDHPLVYLIHNWIPLYLPAIALHVHILPFLFVLCITSIEELVTYSGYSILPSGIILPGMAQRIDYHFLVRGDGNYSAVGVLDLVSGTSVGADVIEDVKAEWEKHSGEQRLIDAGDKAGDIMDGVAEKLRGKTGVRRTRKK